MAKPSSSKDVYGCTFAVNMTPSWVMKILWPNVRPGFASALPSAPTRDAMESKLFYFYFYKSNGSSDIVARKDGGSQVDTTA